MKNLLLLFFVLIVVAVGCRCFRGATEQAVDNQSATGNWVNPTIFPIYHPLIEGVGVEGMEKTTKEQNGDGLVGFLDRKNALFATSSLTGEEAARVYLALFRSGLIKNESVEMPDPANPVEAESIDDFKTRVALKAKPDGGYFVFFRRSGCGFTYFYGAISIDVQTYAVQVQPIEVWRAIVPC